MLDLSPTLGMIIDMDGVLWRGDKYLPGMQELFGLLRDRDIRFVLATNNATKTPEEIQAKLGRGGVWVELHEVLTSAQAAAAYLKRRLPNGALVYAIGEAGLRTALAEAGLQTSDRSDDVQAVIVGLDRNVNWEMLTEASLAVQRGATFIGTNPDPSLPVERGHAVGNGALLAAIATATGVQPTVVGKPEPHLFAQALERLGTPPERTVVLGDRLGTDILGGQRAGLATALVLTGATHRRELAGAEVRPNWVFEDLHQVILSLRGEEG